MPDKGLSVATYAAGASLATIALVYVFAPTYFIDNNPPSSSSNPLSSLTSRKTSVVGLANAANDCFINSVLQALAGLGDLRIYLIRETHRRKIDDAGVYLNAVPQDADVDGSSAGSSKGAAPTRRVIPIWKIEGLQAGLVTKGLKDMIDMLNERPIYKKVISAAPFVRVLETAFRQRISRQQQDAQEFLQIVAERLCDEYHAGQRARRYAKRQAAAQISAAATPKMSAASAASTAIEGHKPLDSEAVGKKLAGGEGAAETADASEAPEASEAAAVSSTTSVGSKESDTDEEEEEKGFPMEGKIESQIECLTCHFRPRPSEQAFCTLTLNVPQASSTSLSECFDMMLKTEYIDDFKCEKCRLVHAHEMLRAELANAQTAQAPTAKFQREATVALAELQRAIETDPEHPPPSIVLPDVKYAPKRRIARHFRLVSFPKVLAIHLSRSIFDSSNISQKNSAKVSFPERLPLGGLLHRREYKLLSVIMHKGSHYSGHYESFRRQTVAAPFSNPNTFHPSQVYSPASTPMVTTPRIGTSDAALGLNGSSPGSSTAELPPATTNGASSSSPSQESLSPSGPKSSAAAPIAGRTSQSSSLRRGRSSSAAAAAAAAAHLTSAPTSAPCEDDANGDATADTSSLRSVARSTLSRFAPSSRSLSRNGSRHSASKAAADDVREASGHAAAQKNKSHTVAATTATTAHVPRPKKKKAQDRWWRISDEKVREASTREVLGMQREVYLLFYELERDPLRR